MVCHTSFPKNFCRSSTYSCIAMISGRHRSCRWCNHSTKAISPKEVDASEIGSNDGASSHQWPSTILLTPRSVYTSLTPVLNSNKWMNERRERRRGEWSRFMMERLYWGWRWKKGASGLPSRRPCELGGLQPRPRSPRKRGWRILTMCSNPQALPLLLATTTPTTRSEVTSEVLAHWIACP